MRTLIALLVVATTLAVEAKVEEAFNCSVQTESVLSKNYNETVAHAIHSMTVQGLRLFNPRASASNSVPTVNLDLSSEDKVLPYAPDVPLGHDFATQSMAIMDGILSTIGNAKDGLGPNWSPIERTVHVFHMWDVWNRILPVFNVTPMPSEKVCNCLTAVNNNGIYDAVLWVARHYESGTPITLLNRPIPKLKDAASWTIWKERLLHYYQEDALRDAAMYLKCATAKY